MQCIWAESAAVGILSFAQRQLRFSSLLPLPSSLMESAWHIDWAHLPQPLTTLVHTSCAAFTASDRSAVTIDEAALNAFVDELDHTQLHSKPKRQFPLHFPSPRSEVNFLTLLDLLQIGSGWRVALHAQRSGRGAAETITFGCMGMHISGEISAEAMIRVGLFDVAQLFQLKIQEEFEITTGVSSQTLTLSDIIGIRCKPSSLMSVTCVSFAFVSCSDSQRASD